MADRHVSIIGCCVLRDIIGMGYDNNSIPENKGYVVDRYVQAVSPVSAVQKTGILNDDITVNATGLLKSEDFADIKNFVKRNFELDCEKRVFDYLTEVQSEYLILDMADVRFNLIKFFKGNTETYLTNDNTWYVGAVAELEKMKCVNSDYEHIVSDDEVMTLIEKYVPVYIEKILEFYPKEKIILVEVLPSDFYLNGDNAYLFEKETVRKYRKRIKYAYSVAKKILKGCHVIEFPDNTVATAHHKWGKNPFHYTEEYYVYALKAFDIIMHEKSGKLIEESKLELLKEKFGELYYNRYHDTIIDSYARKSENDKETMSCLLKYSEYFKNLVLEPERAEVLVNYIQKKGYKHCAFYGYTKISELYIEMFKKAKIQIDYIVEVSKEDNIKGIPVISRFTETFPKTDIIVISDIMNSRKIKKRLTETTNIPFIDAYESVRRYKIKTIKKSENGRSTASIFAGYSDYFKQLVLEPEKSEALVNYMQKNNYKHCAFYGYNKISDMYIEILNKTEIKTDYIIEISKQNTIKGIPVISRSAEKFPETDVIVISDTVNMTDIKKRISNITNIPFIDVYEILKK